MGGNSTTYCRTYDTDWGSTTGNQGLYYYDGTKTTSDDVNTSGSNNSLNVEYLQMYIGCPGSSDLDTALTSSSSTVTTLDSYEDGALFDKCIKITDWVSANLSTSITLTERDSFGCCASDEVPGQYHSSNYYGAQVICGFEDDGSRSFSTSSRCGTSYTCTYNNCFVHKQNLPCDDGSSQLLNGCCSSSSCSSNNCNFETDCKNYYNSMNNAQGATTYYCRTYDTDWGSSTGNQGLSYYDGTTSYTDDVNTSGSEVSLNTDLLKMYVACDGQSCSCDTNTKSVSEITLDDYEDGALFDKCIKITDWETATLSSTINVTERDSYGCCACDEVPGQYHNTNYYGAQIICGFESDGSRYFSMGASSSTCTCTYNTCFVHKQNLTCGNGSQQLLNGCCASSSSCSQNDCNFADGCQNYKTTMYNAQGASTSYCRTYDWDWFYTSGNQGVAYYDGTKTTSDDVNTTGTDSLITDNLQMYISCDGSYGTSSSTRTSYCGSSSSTVSTITLDSYDDGALFDKCIKLTDWVSATLSSEINVTDRDSNGCCACDEVPGLYHSDDYYSAQVICGFEDDGSRSFSTSSSNYAYTCTYNNCYVHKQDFDCADGSKQLLNGCCSNSSCATNDCNFETDCKNYYYFKSNAQGYSTTFCRTFHRNWASSTGNEGVEDYDGTTSTADDITVSGNTTTLDTDKLQMYIGCEHTDDSSTHR